MNWQNSSPYLREKVEGIAEELIAGEEDRSEDWRNKGGRNKRVLTQHCSALGLLMMKISVASTKVSVPTRPFSRRSFDPAP